MFFEFVPLKFVDALWKLVGGFGRLFYPKPLTFILTNPVLVEGIFYALTDKVERCALVLVPAKVLVGCFETPDHVNRLC